MIDTGGCTTVGSIYCVLTGKQVIVVLGIEPAFEGIAVLQTIEGKMTTSIARRSEATEGF